MTQANKTRNAPSLTPVPRSGTRPTKGTQYRHFTQVAGTLALEPNTLGEILGINERTLQRRAKSGHLDEAESLKTDMVHATLEFARTVFGNHEQASAWMTSKLPALGFKRPIDVLVTLDGYERARTILGRLAAGAF
jgi:putative toxin-antitoxin system antitoxin component (TIGR02293 family)